VDASRGIAPSPAQSGREAAGAVLKGGTAAAVTAVLTPAEGRHHAEGQHLELVDSEGERGGAVAPSPVPFRWLV